MPVFCQICFSLPNMSSSDAKLYQINTFLGGGINGIIKKPNCKLFFESNAEARKGDKTRKPCIIYIIYDSILICRPRKYGKKYYVKYQLPIESLHIDTTNSLSSNGIVTKEGNPILLVTQDRSEYSIWYVHVQ